MAGASGFRSTEAREAYCRLYDAAVAQSAEPVREVDLDGADGTTHVLIAGDPANPPLVALHAKSMSSTMWLPLLPALTTSHCVYMLDAVGDLNKSVARRVLSSPALVAAWIEETLDTLGLGSVAVVGASIGAWMGAHHAMAAPERVERLAMLCPGGLVSKVHFRWMMHAVMTAAVRPTPDRLTAFLESMVMPASVPRLHAPPWDLMGRQFVEGIPTFRSRPDEPRPRLADLDPLAGAGMPLLAMVGTEETFHDGPQMAQRFQSRLPEADVVLVDDANHLVFVDQPARVTDALRTFLTPVGEAA